MSVQLDTLLQHPAIWRVGDMPATVRSGISTGYGMLDQALPDSGWPIGALCEILAHEGIGEFSLLLPALRTAYTEGKHVALIGAPYVVYSRALEAAGLPLPRVLVVHADGLDALWAAEQALRIGACGVVVLWATRGRCPNYRSLQRLHGAAAQGAATCVLYRPPNARTTPSAATLRIACGTDRGHLVVEIVKCRGVLSSQPIVLTPFPPHWSQPIESPTASVHALLPVTPTNA